MKLTIEPPKFDVIEQRYYCAMRDENKKMLYVVYGRSFDSAEENATKQQSLMNILHPDKMVIIPDSLLRKLK